MCNIILHAAQVLSGQHRPDFVETSTQSEWVLSQARKSYFCGCCFWQFDPGFKGLRARSPMYAGPLTTKLPSQPGSCWGLPRPTPEADLDTDPNPLLTWLSHSLHCFFLFHFSIQKIGLVKYLTLTKSTHRSELSSGSWETAHNVRCWKQERKQELQKVAPSNHRVLHHQRGHGDAFSPATPHPGSSCHVSKGVGSAGVPPDSAVSHTVKSALCQVASAPRAGDRVSQSC